MDNRERARRYVETWLNPISDWDAARNELEAALDAAESRGKEAAFTDLEFTSPPAREIIYGPTNWATQAEIARATTPIAESRGRPIADEATVERVARASFEVMPSVRFEGGSSVTIPETWDEQSPLMKNVYRTRARAALAAIPAPPAGESERG